VWRYNLTFTNLCLHLSVLIQELTSAIQNYIIVYALWQQISTAYIKLIFDNAIWCFNVLNVHKALILSRPIHLTRYLDKGLFQKCTVRTKFDIYGFFYRSTYGHLSRIVCIFVPCLLITVLSVLRINASDCPLALSNFSYTYICKVITITWPIQGQCWTRHKNQQIYYSNYISC
jgi:hypothetical protein